MKKIFLLGVIFLLITQLIAQEVVKPKSIFKTDGLAKDFVIENELVYVATSKGVIQVLEYKTGKLIEEIELPKINDGVNKKQIAPTIFSIDKLPEKEIFVVTSQGTAGKSDIYIYNYGFWNKIENLQELPVRKVAFLDSHTIIIALLSNEIIKYNIFLNRTSYQRQITKSSFAHFCLNESKTTLAITDESGAINFIDLAIGKVIKTLKKENVDKVFQLDYKNNKILAGGQDRRIAFYDMTAQNSYYIQKDFLIYSVALNSQATIAACQANEACDIIVFTTSNKQEKYILKGHNGLLNKISFVNDNQIISAAEDEKVIFWEI